MPPCRVAIKQSKMPLRRRQGERQKAIVKQNNILARASRFFLTFLCRHCTSTIVKLPNFTFYRKRELTATNLSYSF